MPRIPAKPVAQYPWYIRIFFYFQKRKWGAVPEPLLLWGRAPSVLIRFLALWSKLNRKGSPLSPPLRALICLRVSQFSACPACIDFNTSLLLQRGCRQEKIEALVHYQTDPLFDEKERIALLYAEQVSREKSPIDDELFAQLKTHFDADAIVELTALIGFQNMSSKFNSALDA